ncbi:MAG TPA: glycosyltransferase family 2 protein [Flavobacteriaceae bacterium]|nr:glycosyltransferase family 2 protein [Flavobacteriaceae bacterium]
MNDLQKNVFVILVSYNGEQWLQKNLQALKNSICPVKTIVVDNNSTDGSVAVIKSFPDVELILSDKNLGFGLANTIAIKEALSQSADYVFLLNQDAWVFSETIGNLVEAAEANKDFGILSPVHFSGDGIALDKNFETYWNKKIQVSGTKIDEVPFVNAAAWLVPKKVVEKVGFFELLFSHYGEDRNYADRVLFHGFKIGVVKNAKICHDRIIKRHFKKDVVQSKYKLLARVLNVNNSVFTGYANGLLNVFGLPKYFYKYYSLSSVAHLFFILLWYYLGLLFNFFKILKKRVSYT